MPGWGSVPSSSIFMSSLMVSFILILDLLFSGYLSNPSSSSASPYFLHPSTECVRFPLPNPFCFCRIFLCPLSSHISVVSKKPLLILSFCSIQQHRPDDGFVDPDFQFRHALVTNHSAAFYMEISNVVIS